MFFFILLSIIKIIKNKWKEIYIMKKMKNIILGLGAGVTSLVLASTALSCSSNSNYDLTKLNIKAIRPEFDNPVILNGNEFAIINNNTNGSEITLTPENLDQIFPILEKLFNFGENNIPSKQLLEWNNKEIISIWSSVFDSRGEIGFRLRQNIDGVSTGYNFINGKPYSSSSYWKY